jgi:hypothetical protein
MTKLIYDYDSPENNTKVLKARAKLPAHIGGHVGDKKARVLYREGFAVAKAFNFSFAFGMDEFPYLSLETPVKLSALQRTDEYWGSVSPDDPYRIFHSGVTDGAHDHPASREAVAKLMEAEDDADEPEEICNTCYMARELHDYMNFRAAREGVGHTLTEEHYHQVLDAGAAGAFGITWDIDQGVILADTQNPEALEVWLDTCRCCGKSIKASYHDHEGEAEAAD